ncbi:flagellar hook-basal body complex protein [Selenomonas sp. FC4001]|uniref:flagellar hook-basal body complex protein n=1 Tax=Selenomonas sp. FC4001 TaxID=1408313 RepID=UPI00068B5E95|nr:flagellar hook-basal body complex protein [Selenomonas sp. FC4001]
MMRSLFSGVSGLKGHQTRMDVIGNNIANVNATGFKSSRVTFADTLSQTQTGASAPGDTIGGTNPKQIGLGTGVASIDLLFTDGSVQATGKNTDLCLSGNGLFVVKSGNETYYTRDGAFEFDAEGNYVLPGNGMKVQGWTAKDGVLTTNAAAGDIQIKAGKSMASAATTTATYANNLNAAEKTIAGIKLNDSKGNTITIDPANTDSWSVGGTYTTTISNLDVIFSNGISITSAKGQYGMNANYAIGATTATLSDGSSLSIPKTSTNKYNVGGTLPAVQSLNSGIATLKDGAEWTTSQTFTLTLANGDTVSVPSTSTGSYAQGSALSDTVDKISGAIVTLNTGSVLNNNSGTTYTVTLGNGEKISLPPTQTGTYTKNAAFSDTVASMQGNKVTLVTGGVLTHTTTTNYTVTLANNDTIDLPYTQTGSYIKGASISDTVASVQGKKVILATGGELTNNSGTSYTSSVSGTIGSTSVSGGTLNISSSSSTTYVPSGTISHVLTAADIVAGTITLTDGGSTITGIDLSSFTAGDTVSLTLGAITGLPAATVSSITGLPSTTVSSITDLPSSSVLTISPASTPTISSLAGTVTSGDGTEDNWSTTSSTVTLTPNKGLTTSTIKLTDGDGNTLKINNSDATPYKAGDTYTSKIDALSIELSDGTTSVKTSGSYTMGYSLPLTTSLNIYDTLGNAHSVIVYFTKTKTDSINGNQWTAQINLDGSGSTTVTEPDGSTTTISMADTTLQFTTTGKYSEGSGNLNLTLTNGSTGSQTINVDLSQLTQYAGNSTINGTTDGNAAGTLKSVSVDSSGVITGTYTNGVKQAEAQVAIAQFTNASGLLKTGSSLYQESNNSGTPNVKTATDLGVTITPSALEMSNVDIANEFSDMIITQRGFQSNSKVITVGDEMLETLINMKR